MSNSTRKRMGLVMQISPFFKERGNLIFRLSKKQTEDDHDQHEQTDKVTGIGHGMKIFYFRKMQLIEMKIQFRNLFYDFLQPIIQFLSSFRPIPEKRVLCLIVEKTV
jgi:hypothetical protein